MNQSDDWTYSELLIYYIVVNGMIVFASAALDKSKAIIDLFYPRDSLDLRKNCEFVNGTIANCKRIIKGLLSNEIDFHTSEYEDLQCVISD